jgi:beta-galactosidase
VFSGKIIDQFERYSRPQETGNKIDVRWAEIASKDISLRVNSNNYLNTSTWPFTMTVLDINSEY